MTHARAASDSSCTPRVLFLTTHASYFAHHWIRLARNVRQRGFQVIAAAAGDASVSSIEREGIIFRNVAFDRFGTNALRELATIVEITRLYAELKPSLAHHFGHKPVVYGAIAARLNGVPAIGTVPGLGYAFVATGLRALAARSALEILYRILSTSCPTRLIFQNPGDRRFFLRRGFVRRHRAALVLGAGVDCRTFAPHPERAGLPVVVLVGRMLRDKGIPEFIEAARLIARRGIRAHFILAGAAEATQRSGITEAQLRTWTDEGVVNWIGHISDVPGLLARAHIVCLPSHVEGLPLSLAEAAAAGRAIVASDIPGCRAVVRHGVNGFLVPVGNSNVLAERIAELLLDRDLRERMGAAGREFAVRELAIEICMDGIFDAYNKLGLRIGA